MYKENFGNIPNKDKIISYLEEAYEKNPGRWVLHLWIVGKTAEKIAKDLGLDPEIAFACGALHDIGKATGAEEAAHFFEGYKILRADSYFFPARIALSHSFQIKNVDSYVGEWNISEDNKDLVRDFLAYNEYNDYDLLIQLLDGLIKDEYLGIEKRAEGVADNHGKNPYFNQRKARLYELEEYFQKKLPKPIEKYLPNPRWYKFPYSLFRKKDEN